MPYSWVLVWKYSSPESGFGESMSVATVYGTTLRSAPCSAHAGMGLLRSLPMTPSKFLPSPARTGALAHCPGNGSQTARPRCDPGRGTYPAPTSAISPYPTDRDRPVLDTSSVHKLAVHQRPPVGIIPLSGSQNHHPPEAISIAVSLRDYLRDNTQGLPSIPADPSGQQQAGARYTR